MSYYYASRKNINLVSTFNAMGYYKNNKYIDTLYLAAWSGDKGQDDIKNIKVAYDKKVQMAIIYLNTNWILKTSWAMAHIIYIYIHLINMYPLILLKQLVLICSRQLPSPNGAPDDR